MMASTCVSVDGPPVQCSQLAPLAVIPPVHVSVEPLPKARKNAGRRPPGGTSVAINLSRTLQTRERHTRATRSASPVRAPEPLAVAELGAGPLERAGDTTVPR